MGVKEARPVTLNLAYTLTHLVLTNTGAPLQRASEIVDSVAEIRMSN